MEPWMTYALGAFLTIGIVSWCHKLQAENKYMHHGTFIFYSYFFQALVWGIVLLFLQMPFVVNWSVFIYGILMTILYTFVIESRLISLKYIDASTYFINYRLLSSIWLLILWQILFGETITWKEYLWIGIGFIIFYLLLEKKNKNEKKTDFKKGIIFLLYGAILITVLQLLAKDFVITWIDIISVVIMQGIIGMSIQFLRQEKNIDNYKIKWKRNILFMTFTGIIFCASGILNNYAYIGWDVAVVYKIISYSIFIPIIFSVIYYKEKVTWKKLLAFALTIVSILLFM